MDLSQYSLEDCLLAAYKSEIESEKIYTTLSKAVQNVFLKDRLDFLAGEEKKHQKVFAAWYSQEFPTKSLTIPEVSPVPLPEVQITGDRVAVSEVLQQAMRAEEAATIFYREIADKLPQDDERRKALFYIAAMEKTHYKIIEGELETAEYLEGFNTEWPMMHIGP